MLQTRKNVLDKARTELADSVNGANQIYTNEELSVLLSDAQNTIKSQTDKINLLEKKFNDNNNDINGKITDINNKMIFTNQKKFLVQKKITPSNIATSSIVVNTGTRSGPISISVRLLGEYGFVNYGGYATYDMGAFMTDGICYGFGDNIVKKGSMGTYMDGISTSCSQVDSTKIQIITMNLKFNTSYEYGSGVYAIVDVYTGYGAAESATVTFN